jgi:hypothetical protein
LEIIESPLRISGENDIAWAETKENPSPMARASEATLRIAFSFLFVIGAAATDQKASSTTKPKGKCLNRR